MKRLLGRGSTTARWAPRTTGSIAALVVIFVGCSGGAVDSNGDGASTDGDDDRPGEPPAPPKACGGEKPSGRDPMRRLTALEYDFVLEDLLGDTRGLGREYLPVDEITAGYANNAVINLQENEAVQIGEAARKAAEQAITKLDEHLACREGVAPDECAQDFIARFGRLALRRPLSSEELDELVGLYRDKREKTDHAQGIRLYIETVLQLPSFFYRPVLGVETQEAGLRKLTAYDVASRLSFFLWSSIPDEDLLDAAEQGTLDKPEGVYAQALRLMDDPRFERSLTSFSLQWLDMGEQTPAKNSDKYPEFSPELWQSAREGVARYFAHSVREGHNLKDLLTQPVVFVDANLAPIYDLDAGGDGMNAIETAPEKRSGLMTQAGVMAALGNSGASLPIKRGLFVRNRLLCQDPPPPPPEGIPPFEADTTGMTIRQQLEAHRASPSCKACHAFFDDLGLAFEHYDGVGRYHETQADQPVDASGTLSETDVDGPFDDAIGLVGRLSESEVVARCLATQVFRFAIARLESEADSCALDGVVGGFEGGRKPLRELFSTMAMSDAFRFTGND